MGGDEDVGGLDVAVDDAGLVGGGERVGDLGTDLEQPLGGERLAGELLLQGLALHQLHDQKGRALVLADVVQRADVRMVQSGSGARFALEAGSRHLAAAQLLGEELQRDGPLEPGVLGLVDDAHPAAADPAHDPVVRDGLAEHRSSSMNSSVHVSPKPWTGLARSPASRPVGR